MKAIDLTQFISPDMPVYPGTEGPQIVDATSIEQDGFAEKLLTLYSHTGTHIDAPGHMIPGASTLDQFHVDKYIGAARVIDVAGNGTIEKAVLVEDAELLAGCEYLLFHTGWDVKWGQDSYFIGFPVLSLEAASWLCSLGLKGVGFDCISVDAVGSIDMAIHKIILGSGLVIVENLCNLATFHDKAFTFSCLPLRIKEADGSPVRAVGILPD